MSNKIVMTVKITHFAIRVLQMSNKPLQLGTGQFARHHNITTIPVRQLQTLRSYVVMSGEIYVM